MRDMSGLVKVNSIDLWTTYGVFLRESRKGGRENLNALLSAAKMKENVAVDIREQDGESYSSQLTQKRCGRDVTLQFAIYATTAAGFVRQYSNFLNFLRTGNNGWLKFVFPTLDNLTMDMFVKEFPSNFTAISDLWNSGEQCGAFKVTFREPVSTF